MKTIRELSDMWGIDRSTLLKAAQDDRVKAHRSGATWLVDSEDVLTQRWLQGASTGRPRKMIQMLALRERILEYARAIMRYQVEAGRYPAHALVDGLLPLEDVEVDEKRYLGRLSKLADEQAEMREKLPAYLSNPCMQTKVPLLHEIADVAYNRVQAEYLQDKAVVTDVLNDYRLYGIDRREVIAAVDSKFAYRSCAPGMKDQKHEYRLIEEALARLS